MKEEEILIGYKVVRIPLKKNANYFESFTNIKSVKKKYRINKWTKRSKNRGALAVFKTLLYAKTFKHIIYNIGQFKIFKCEYVKSKINYLAYKKHYIPFRKYIEDVPLGTDFAEKVKLIKRIKA